MSSARHRWKQCDLPNAVQPRIESGEFLIDGDAQPIPVGEYLGITIASPGKPVDQTCHRTDIGGGSTTSPSRPIASLIQAK